MPQNPFPLKKVFWWGGVGWVGCVGDFNVYSWSNSIDLILDSPWTEPDLELDNFDFHSLFKSRILTLQRSITLQRDMFCNYGLSNKTVYQNKISESGDTLFWLKYFVVVLFLVILPLPPRVLEQKQVFQINKCTVENKN